MSKKLWDHFFDYSTIPRHSYCKSSVCMPTNIQSPLEQKKKKTDNEPEFFCLTCKHEVSSIKIEVTTGQLHKVLLNSNLVSCYSLACLPSITLPMSKGSIVFCVHSQSSKLSKDQLLYGPHWNKQCPLSSDRATSQRDLSAATERCHTVKTIDKKNEGKIFRHKPHPNCLHRLTDDLHSTQTLGM